MIFTLFVQVDELKIRYLPFITPLTLPYDLKDVPYLYKQ
jgi:hypothetical protein